MRATGIIRGKSKKKNANLGCSWKFINGMKTHSPIDLYKKGYVDLRFERAGLFQVLWEKYSCEQVLYPGCFIHITPSFYFPHVVYVDQHPTTVDFFSNMEQIMEYINRKKTYKRSAFIRFLPQDYSEGLLFKQDQFELLISLYAGGVSNACGQYLKPGGYLVTNNFQGDAKDAIADPEFQLLSVIQYRKKAYQIVENFPQGDLAFPEKAGSKRYLRQVSRGFEYEEAEDYYFFKKGMRKTDI
jgi:hypothetical protein